MSEHHDARCERVYTDSGFVFIDCLCQIRTAKADAWDEGYARGVRDEAGDIERADNPYRVPTTAGEGERGEG